MSVNGRVGARDISRLDWFALRAQFDRILLENARVRETARLLRSAAAEGRIRSENERLRRDSAMLDRP